MFARLRENLVYKLLALGFAIALHFYVVSQENPTQTRTVLVPLTVRSLPSDLIFDEKSAPQIAVTLSGPSDLLGPLPDSDITATIDLSKAHVGKNPPAAVHVILPPAASALVAEPQPSAVPFTLSPRERRSVPITATDPGTPPAGFVFHPAIIMPAVATVSGTQDAVDSVQQVVATVDTNGAVGTIDSTFPVVALDAQGAQVSGVTVTPAAARIHIVMEKAPAAKMLIVSANVSNTLAYPYHVTGISVSPDSVTVTGRPEALAQTYTVETMPIDLAGATSDVVRTVACVPPPGLKIAGPAQVTVTVHIAAQPLPASPIPAATPLGAPTPH